MPPFAPLGLPVLRRRVLGVVLGPVLVAGCTPGWEDQVPAEARAILAEPAAFEILALQPDGLEDREAGFHGYEVLGRAEVTDPAVRRRVVELIARGVDANDGSVAACFNPRHGVRAEGDGGRVDLVICFECLQITVHGPGESWADVLTSDAVTGRMNAIYREHGLAIHGPDEPPAPRARRAPGAPLALPSRPAPPRRWRLPRPGSSCRTSRARPSSTAMAPGPCAGAIARC